MRSNNNINLLVVWLFLIVQFFNVLGANPPWSIRQVGNDLLEVRETHCECGLKNSAPRHEQSDGREYAGNHAWPWMVSIVNVSMSDEPVAYCGASLINDRYILTAAHCIPDMNDTGLDSFRVYLGTNMISAGEHDNVFLDLGILNITTHPKFDFETAEYDVSLIKLSESVQFSKWIRPVCLKQTGAPFVGHIGIVTGWGSFNLTQPTDDALKETEVEVVPNDICRQNYSSVDIPVTDTMLCASLPGHDPCKGDSGGPLVVRDTTTSRSNRFSQIGIISHGQGCSVTAFPAIFSRVEKFTEWIILNTQDALYCRGSF